MSQINVDRVVAAYRNGESTVSLARALKKSPTWVRRLLLANGVELRGRAAAAELAYKKQRRPLERPPLSDEVRARIAAGVKSAWAKRPVAASPTPYERLVGRQELKNRPAGSARRMRQRGRRAAGRASRTGRPSAAVEFVAAEAAALGFVVTRGPRPADLTLERGGHKVAASLNGFWRLWRDQGVSAAAAAAAAGTTAAVRVDIRAKTLTRAARSALLTILQGCLTIQRPMTYVIGRYGELEGPHEEPTTPAAGPDGQ